MQFVRIPEDPTEDPKEDAREEIEIVFWVPALPPRIVRLQWQCLKGVRVIQTPWAGVDTLLGIFPPEVT